jgi:hypothetical protein
MKRKHIDCCENVSHDNILNNWSEIPIDMLLEIAKYIKHEDFVNFATCCKKYSLILKNENFMGTYAPTIRMELSITCIFGGDTYDQFVKKTQWTNWYKITADLFLLQMQTHGTIIVGKPQDVVAHRTYTIEYSFSNPMFDFLNSKDTVYLDNKSEQFTKVIPLNGNIFKLAKLTLTVVDCLQFKPKGKAVSFSYCVSLFYSIQ